MITFTDTLVLIGMIVLRIGIPLAITAGLVYVLKRLDRKWEKEAQAQQGLVREIDRVAEQAAQLAATSTAQPARQPAKMAVTGRPGSFDAAGTPAPGLVARASGQPCWETKNCPDAKVKACAAYKHPEQACWQARFQAEGKIPDQCPRCEIFQNSPLN